MKYRWACYGTGTIAKEAAEAMKKMGISFYSVGNRNHEHAVSFAEKYHINKVYDNPEDMFQDSDVDIVYIATPHNTHSAIMNKALLSGKHVLCEKSITLNDAQLEEAIHFAEEKKLVLAEAQTVYHMPLYRLLKKRMLNGDFGQLRVIQMNFGSYKPYDMNNRFWNIHTGGGAMLEIGVYALSFARWFLTSTPDEITSKVKLAPNGVDEQSGIVLMNKEQELTTITISMHAKQPKRGIIAFDQCYIEVYAYPRADKAVITWTKDGHQEEISAGSTEDALCYEFEDMENAVSGKDNEMFLQNTLDVMKLMTKLRYSWKIRYPEENQSSSCI